MKGTIITVVILAVLAVSCSKLPVKVACVGDSITEGARIKWQSKDAYPVILDSLLGTDYTVINCGRSAATLQKEGDLPYWRCNEFSNVFALSPDIIIIKLGTNDTKPQNWNPDRFESDYQAMIDTFKTIASHPKICVCIPVPVFKTRWGINDSTLTNGVIPIVKMIADKNHLETIDLYKPMLSMGAEFPDDIHPNEKGAFMMAEIVSKAIK